MRAIRSIVLMPVLLLAGVVGCGNGETWAPEIKDAAFPVKGKVLLPGGRPLSSGRIEFIPAQDPGLIAFGDVGPDGSFELKTREPGDGAIPGDYKVRIMIPERTEYSALSRYRDEDSSQLTATIKPEPNTLEPFALR